MIVKWALPSYLRQDQVRAFFSVITSLRDKALFTVPTSGATPTFEAAQLAKEFLIVRQLNDSRVHHREQFEVQCRAVEVAQVVLDPVRAKSLARP